MSFSIILPSLQPYLARNSASPYFYGGTVAVYSVGEMLGAVFFGKIYEIMTLRREDGAKITLLLSIAFGLVGSFLYVYADVVRSPNLIFAGRLFQGLWTGGKQVVEQTYLSETAPPSRVTALTSELGTFAILGFVCGPSFGALFTHVDVVLGDSGVVLDAYTSPGWFIFALCVVIFGVVILTFNPTPSPAYYAYQHELARGMPAGSSYISKQQQLDEMIYAPPNKGGLLILLLIFVIHFFSFAIQETITTPFVIEAYGFDQQSVNLLFVGVGLVSLITSIVIKYLSNCVSDYTLLVSSLLIGLVGSLFLVDSLPFSQPAVQLPLGRFFIGFTLVTIAFPFGRNVSLSVFSQILGPTPQGHWFGLMFAAGALPRIVGPSWSIFALLWACRIEHMECWMGGRTWLLFGILAALFALGGIMLAVGRKAVRPYGSFDMHSF